MNDEHFKEENMVLIKALLIALSVLLIVLTVSTLVGIQNKIKEGKYIGQEIESKNTITVSESGEVYAKPDLAKTTLSVTTEAETVTEAMNENTEKMSSIVDSVKKQGIEDKDLKTLNFNIYPRYEWHEKGTCVIPCPQGRRVLVGYEVHQSLQVKIRDIEKTGDIIEQAVEAGASQVGSLEFTIDNQDDLKKQAREQAIQKVKTKAEELASQLGVTLGRITNFRESETSPYYYRAESMEALGGGGDFQIETGENEIKITATITYEIY